MLLHVDLTQVEFCLDKLENLPRVRGATCKDIQGDLSFICVRVRRTMTLIQQHYSRETWGRIMSELITDLRDDVSSSAACRASHHFEN